MGSYNQINGEQACESPWLLNHVLRELWGFKGTVLSDWGAVKDSVKAVKAGLDLQMPHSIQYMDSVKKRWKQANCQARTWMNTVSGYCRWYSPTPWRAGNGQRWTGNPTTGWPGGLPANARSS